MFLKIGVYLPFFIAFVVVGLCAFYFVIQTYRSDKQLHRCKKELELLKQHHSLLDSNFNNPQTSATIKTAVKSQSKGDEAV